MSLFLKALLGLSLFFALVCVALFKTTLFHPLLQHFLPNTDHTFYDFSKPSHSHTANDFWIVSQSHPLVSNSTLIKSLEGRENNPNQPAIIEFNLDDVNGLIAFINQQDGIELLMSNDHQYEWLIRTPVMRYPDRISLHFNQDGIAIYSRSIYGKLDFQANETRLKMWLEQFLSTIK